MLKLNKKLDLSPATVGKIIEQLETLDEQSWGIYVDNFFPGFMTPQAISQRLGFAADLVIRDFSHNPYTMVETLEIRRKTDDANPAEFQHERITRLYHKLYQKRNPYEFLREGFLRDIPNTAERKGVGFLLGNNRARLEIHLSHQTKLRRIA